MGCVWQLDNLERYCAASNGQAAVTGQRAALSENLAAGRLSAILGIEGAHAIEGQVDRVAELARRGVRFMSLTHLANNELGGTSTPLMGNRPLTPLGREVLDAMGHHGMAIDVAHASASMMGELLAHPSARPFCSHAGVQGATPLWRNLDDPTLEAIANKGGVAGVIFAPQFIGGRQLSDVARHIEHAVNVMGEDGVALGSDYDGMIPLPQGMRDVRDLKRLTEVLVSRQLPVRVVEKVLGHNFRRFWGEVLA
jgi:membrane dipeptidase